jgi:hypothetical protein
MIAKTKKKKKTELRSFVQLKNDINQTVAAAACCCKRHNF